MICASLKPITKEALKPIMDAYPDLPQVSWSRFEAKRLDLPTRRLAALVLIRTLLIKAKLYPEDQAKLAKIKHLETGQPFLDIPGANPPFPFISISHSGKWIGCIVGEGSSPIGLDLEDMNLSRSLDRIADHTFFEDEKKFLESDQELGFYKIWGAKESIAKCFGKGLAKALSINAGELKHGNQVVVKGVSYSLYQDVFEKSIFISIAQQTKQQQEIRFLEI